VNLRPKSPSSSEASIEAATPSERKAPARSRWWLLPFAVAAVEIGGHFVVQARVVPESDWDAAAAHVRAEWAAGDVVSVAPHWADPLLRRAMGDEIDIAQAGRADLAPYRRYWSFSIRGHRAADAPPEAPDHVRTFGRVRVERWNLPQDESILYDFVAHIADAEVSVIEGGQARVCPFSRAGRPTGGGLGSGPIVPKERHVCDPRRPWMWVGATVEEDLEMLPRHCIWQHASGSEPVRARFSNVPLGESIVLYGGLWWEHERTMDGGPVDVTLRIDGQEAGRLTHRDGDGWKRIEAAVPEALRGGQGQVDIEVSASNPHLRSLCWAATTRTIERAR
jgi:hypothetical protein